VRRQLIKLAYGPAEQLVVQGLARVIFDRGFYGRTAFIADRLLNGV
jgi:hypothetical protein